MKNSWVMWVFILVVVATVLFIFNRQESSKTKSLSEIFPETENQVAEIEYIQDDQSQTVVDVVNASNNLSEASKSLQGSKVESGIASSTASAITKSAEVVPAKSAKSSSVEVAKTTAKESTKAAVVSKASPKAAYTIQVASFKDKSKADKVLADLKKKEYAPYLKSKDLKEKGVWYRVYVGEFDKKIQAEDFLTKIKSNYSSSYIVSLK